MSLICVIPITLTYGFEIIRKYMIYIPFPISWPAPPKHDRQYFLKKKKISSSYPGVSKFSTNQNPVFYRCFQNLGLGQKRTQVVCLVTDLQVGMLDVLCFGCIQVLARLILHDFAYVFVLFFFLRFFLYFCKFIYIYLKCCFSCSCLMRFCVVVSGGSLLLLVLFLLLYLLFRHSICNTLLFWFFLRSFCC